MGREVPSFPLEVVQWSPSSSSRSRATPSVEVADGVVVIGNETADRVANVVVTVVPVGLVVLAAWFAWGGALHWQDLVVLAVTYLLTGLGITVGYHRLFTHRSFKSGRMVRVLFAVLGSAAIEGPVIEWVATTASTIASQTSTGILTAPTSTMATAGWVRCVALPTRTSDGSSEA